ncbi:MAG: hypothetical protein QGG97_01325 [Flavobacteriales bacterium]|jgi:hypothetical protein|nr:hypothetical protein [Flavobacteriales bacterium]MDP7430170.1 hypothetical protein [Flavobacteriales bacterium]|tara:strand:- start:4642 stop:6420 length:1779 start_codon:yes stop_codon:yes gene_type:complete
MTQQHSFHIPVMGTAFTADTPLKVAQFGIDSVIALADDVLLERLRKVYADKNNLQYEEIKNNTKDYRADRITSYLNLVNKLANQKYEEYTTATKEKVEALKTFFATFPDTSQLKKEFNKLTKNYFNIDEISPWLKENLNMGSIDVNIMTKVDKPNFFKNEALPSEYNDAHAALRGYANSDLASSIIFSAGMNPRLYGYISQFEDFYPNADSYIKKKIVLKVSDYRSALIQGKFLAKKGLWVSEYRVESGLNCGGHAFATDGYLMGPILAEFREKREELIKEVYEICKTALAANNRVIPKKPLALKITAQGGVGTAEEHDFLIKHYELDSVGWGTPFLLVPEVTNVDDKTRMQLVKAKEKDLYLSNVSPLGVPFNNLRNSSKDAEKLQKVKDGKPGSPCPRRYLAFSTEYDGKGVCTASRLYQKNKIEELGVSDEITEKVCLCMGLSAAVITNGIEAKESTAVSICPGPNMAYFDKLLSLEDMTKHIYGLENFMSRTDRPNMFVKELNLYMDFFKNKLEEAKKDWNKKQEEYFNRFLENMNEGFAYYTNMFDGLKDKYEKTKQETLASLEKTKSNLALLALEVEALEIIPVVS